MSTFGINDGHTISGAGSGAVGKISESEHTRLVGGELRALLTQRGANVINCTVDYAGSSSEALALIVQQANRTDLDWFISIHFNANKGRGVEVYTYEGRQYEDATEVCRNIASLGFANRGVKAGTGLYVIRKTKAKSMLIEVCFVDSEDADHYLTVGYKAVAKSIADALVAYIEPPQPVKNPTIKYQAHVQNIGWQDEKRDGETAGTEGQSLRLEAFSILYDGSGIISIEGHIQNIGWQTIRHNGEIIGTIGRELRLEALKMSLQDADGYSLQYRCHIENIGWTDWAANGAVCGTVGESKRIEAIQIRLVK